LTVEISEIPLDSPEWEENVNKPVQKLTKEVLEVFPHDVAREFLTVLGSSESPLSSNLKLINYVPRVNQSACSSADKKGNLLLAKKKSKTQQQSFSNNFASFKTKNCNCNNKKETSANFKTVDDCECSTDSDWCWLSAYCSPEGCRIKQFCGTGLIYFCNGLCVYDYDDCTC
jgi:hypothetical protein